MFSINTFFRHFKCRWNQDNSRHFWNSICRFFWSAMSLSAWKNAFCFVLFFVQLYKRSFSILLCFALFCFALNTGFRHCACFLFLGFCCFHMSCIIYWKVAAITIAIKHYMKSNYMLFHNYIIIKYLCFDNTRQKLLMDDTVLLIFTTLPLLKITGRLLYVHLGFWWFSTYWMSVYKLLIKACAAS